MAQGKVSSSRNRLIADLRTLGIKSSDIVMVHASIKAIGPIEDGPATVLGALRNTLGDGGTLLAYVSRDRSPYEETLGDASLTLQERDAWPAFIQGEAGAYPGFGILNAFILAHPRVHRSVHPDASMAAIGPDAAHLVANHGFGDPYGPGSPLENLSGKMERPFCSEFRSMP